MEPLPRGAALDKPAAELTVMDVYDMAAAVGQEFERLIDRYGREAPLRLMPKVVRVLEVLEVFVTRGGGDSDVGPGTEEEELRRELDKLRRERSDRYEKGRKQQKELELLEDAWRGETQDLLSQISRLQAENRRLQASLSLKDAPPAERELQKPEEREVTKRLTYSVEKQRDEIRAKDRELSRRNEDVEALQMQQHRLMRINQGLRHRMGVLEAQGKSLIQQRAELEAAAQAQQHEAGAQQQEVGALQQEVGALQLELTRLRDERQEWELQRERHAAEEELRCPHKAGTSPLAAACKASDPIKPNSVWVECGGDAGFMADCFESEETPPLGTAPTNAIPSEEGCEEDCEEDKDLELCSPVTGSRRDTGDPDGETDGVDPEPDKPRFTLQELRDVLQERNELKSRVFALQEELEFYKSEESEDDACFVDVSPSPVPADPPESGIRRLIFTAIMPMVAAGLIQDDPTLLPIRRLYSYVEP